MRKKLSHFHKKYQKMEEIHVRVDEGRKRAVLGVAEYKYKTGRRGLKGTATVV
jgi:hypothetical protein